MNAELLKKALWAASTALNRNGSHQEAVESVLRVAIEACATIANQAMLPPELSGPKTARAADKFGCQIGKEILALLT